MTELRAFLESVASTSRHPAPEWIDELAEKARSLLSETQRTIECLCPKCGVKHGGLSEAQ